MSKMDHEKQLELGRKANKVFALKRAGYSNAKIAEEVDLPESTVRLWTKKLMDRKEN